MKKEACFYLGNIVGKYSFRGEVLAKIEGGVSQDYTKLELIFVDMSTELVPFFVVKCSFHKTSLLRIQFEEVNDESQANELLKKNLYLPLSLLPPLTGNKFYYHEIIGYRVFNEKELIGILVRVDDQLAQALFEVDWKGQLVLIPVHDDLIQEINRQKKRLTLKLPEGLLELFD